MGSLLENVRSLTYTYTGFVNGENGNTELRSHCIMIPIRLWKISHHHILVPGWSPGRHGPEINTMWWVVRMPGYLLQVAWHWPIMVTSTLHWPIMVECGDVEAGPYECPYSNCYIYIINRGAEHPGQTGRCSWSNLSLFIVRLLQTFTLNWLVFNLGKLYRSKEDLSRFNLCVIF